MSTPLIPIPTDEAPLPVTSNGPTEEKYELEVVEIAKPAESVAESMLRVGVFLSNSGQNRRSQPTSTGNKKILT
jgi:hypothetical protein